MLKAEVESTEVACSLILVRVGVVGHVGRFLPVEPVRLSRGNRVVCRTVRGLEMGVVLSSTPVSHSAVSDLLGSELADSELADSELADSELADSELADSELADSELADSELADSELADDSGFAVRGLADGRLLRRTTAEDELLWSHLQQLGEAAYQSCVARLAEIDSTAVLVEVEPLLDGRTLYFHFLTKVDEQVQSQLDELVEIYEQKVRESKFANLLNHGCGPGCGTAKAKNGCAARGGCAVCKVTATCGKLLRASEEKI